LVLFYAVAVFVSFLAGLAAMTRVSLRDGRRGLAAVNALGALSVAFTLVVNLGRGYPLLSLAATALIARSASTPSGGGPGGRPGLRSSSESLSRRSSRGKAAE